MRLKTLLFHMQLESSAIGILASYAAIIWFLLEIITMLTNEKRRAIHDKIASTVVIDLEASELKVT